MMKHALLWFLCLSAAVANPIVVYEGVRDTQMTSEDVMLRVGREETAVTGDYTFVQLAAKTSKKEDEFIRILLPVYIQKDAEPKLADMKSAYAPRVSVQGVVYEPSDVGYGGHPWASFWRGAKFVLAAFEFVIPRSGLPDQFQLHVTYRQPHMTARGTAYACYCPFRPPVQNQLYHEVADQRFTLRAIASDGVNLRRVSKNSKVELDDSVAVTLHCIHLEHVIISIKKA